MAKSRSYRKRKSGSRKYKTRRSGSRKSRKGSKKSRSRKYKSRKSRSRKSRSRKSRGRKSRKGSRKSKKSKSRRRVRKTHKKSPCKGLSQYDCNINPNCDYTTNKLGKSFCKSKAGTLYKRKLSDRLNVFAGPMGRASSFSNPTGYGEGVTLDNYGPSMRLRRRN
jgi:hypothetical protein